jgi:mannosyltransferase OCH1-like enzyme
MMPGWEYRFWTNVEVAPLVTDHFPMYAEVFNRIKLGVLKADIARYMFLSVYGGFYFDTDYKMLRPVDDDTLAHGCILPIARNSGASARLGNAVMASAPRHPFWTDFLAHIFSNADLANLPESKVEEVTGPDGLTAFYFSHCHLYNDIYLPERSMFHPPHSLRGFASQVQPETVGIHLSWGSWRTKNPLAAMFQLSRRKLTSF